MADFPHELPKIVQETPEIVPKEVPVAVPNVFEAPATQEMPSTESAPVAPVEGKQGERAMPVPTPAAPIAAPKDPIVRDVEKILVDGVKEMYLALPANAKPLFKKKGEDAAAEIARMFASAKLQVHRIVQLIRDWLHLIPKVNTFYLEQETKIKTDQIVELFNETEKQKHDSHDVPSSSS